MIPFIALYLPLLPLIALFVRNPPADAGDVRDTGSIPGLGRFPGGGNGNPLQYPCLENPMDRGAWRATVHGIAKRLSMVVYGVNNLSNHEWEGDDRGWDGWMASPTRWTWVWVNSRSWWWMGRPGVLRFTGSQRVGHDWATELNGTESWVN